jgi:hypothetical protein
MIDLNNLIDAFDKIQQRANDPVAQQKSYDEAVARLKVKAEAMIPSAIGRRMCIKTGPKTSTEGVIVEAKFTRATSAGRYGDQLKAVWTIKMECGVKKVIREFQVSVLP